MLHDAVRSIAFATFVTVGADGPLVTQMPLILSPDEGPYGTLYGHVARANPQWRDTRPGVGALALFAGPNAYITPSWYATKAETGRVVPTWNYIAVEAAGVPEFFDDASRLRALVGRQTDRFEAGRPQPWSVDDAPDDYIAAQLRAIVGVRLPIARIHGSWKLSQNRPDRDRAGVRVGLLGEGAPEAQAVAAAMDGA